MMWHKPAQKVFRTHAWILVALFALCCFSLSAAAAGNENAKMKNSAEKPEPALVKVASSESDKKETGDNTPGTNDSEPSINCPDDDCDWDAIDTTSHFMHESVPVFDKTEARFTEDRSAVTFTLHISFRNFEDEETTDIAEAWAYATSDKGEHWKEIPLNKQGGSNNAQVWTGSVAVSEFTSDPYAEIIYLFRAVDIYGNTAMELPVSNPGESMAPGAFFPGITAPDDYRDPVPDSLDILETHLAWDGEHFYHATRYQGAVGKSSGRGDRENIYDTKFTNPAEHAYVHMFYGNHLLFAPSLLYPYTFLDFKGSPLVDESQHRLVDACHDFDAEAVADQDYVVALGDHTLYTRTPLKQICSRGCNELIILPITMELFPVPGALPIDANTGPFAHVYLGAHELGHDAAAAAVSHGMGQAPEPVKILFPDPDSTSPATLRAEDDYERFRDWFNLEWSDESRITTVHNGKGPFHVTSCDVVNYKNYRIEMYTRNDRMKARILRDGEWLHSLMIGYDTKPRRDEQHRTHDIYITLSGFDRNSMSCNVEIEDR